jgi:DNA adenine methylase
MVTQPIKPVVDSFIGWLGGKTKLRPTIISSFPAHEVWVEVFCGSATVFFGKPPSMSRQEFINDLHGELVNLMKVISGTCFDDDVRSEFMHYVRSMPAAREVYQDWKTWGPEQISKLNPAQRAYRFFYCVKKGFSSVPKGGYEASPISSNRLNMNADFEEITKRFRARNAQIECMDFRDLITKYNREDVGTFFFMDPPYFVADGTNYYDYVFTPEDHQALKACCDQITANKNKFLITYDDVPGVIDLYKDYHIYRTDPIVYNAADERGERGLIKTELFVTNYDIADAVIEQVKVKMKKGRTKIDIFVEKKQGDNRIDFPGCIGLEKIN